MSATSVLLFDEFLLGICDNECWRNMMNCENGDVKNSAVVGLVAVAVSCGGVPPCSNRSFWASRDCKMCSSSFTYSMAPLTMEAWSPCTTELCIDYRKLQFSSTEKVIVENSTRLRPTTLSKTVLSLLPIETRNQNVGFLVKMMKKANSLWEIYQLIIKRSFFFFSPKKLVMQ